MTDSALIDHFRREPSEQFRSFIRSEEYLRFSKRAGFRKFSDGQTEPKKRVLSAESVDVYCDMFNSLLRWLDTQKKKINFVDMTEDQLFAFLSRNDENGEPVLKSAIQHRYLRLVEIVFDHLSRQPNPARGLIFSAFHETKRLEGRNIKSVALTPDQIQAFINALPFSSAKLRTGKTHQGWKKRRDRALQCIMLGAGLKVTEAIGLTISELSQTRELDGTLKITVKPTGKNKTSHAHVTFLQVEFVDEILTWCLERSQLDLPPSPLLFPSNGGRPLNPSNVYDAVKKTFSNANLDLPRQGGRTLRNTFGCTEFAQDQDVNIVKDKLGLAEDRSALAYKSIARRHQLLPV